MVTGFAIPDSCLRSWVIKKPESARLNVSNVCAWVCVCAWYEEPVMYTSQVGAPLSITVSLTGFFPSKAALPPSVSPFHTAHRSNSLFCLLVLCSVNSLLIVFQGFSFLLLVQSSLEPLPPLTPPAFKQEQVWTRLRQSLNSALQSFCILCKLKYA